jgi:hypothetical protein
VILAMLPTAVLTLAVFDRTSRTHTPATRRMQGG